MSSDEQLKAAQRRKKQILNNYVNKANYIIREINVLNQQIRNAKECRIKANKISNLIDGIIGDLSAIGEELQIGLKIDGVAVGKNISEESVSIPAGINVQTNSIERKVDDYIDMKTSEALSKKTDVEKVKTNYNYTMASYPLSLGIYAPAPTFPKIPKIESMEWLL